MNKEVKINREINEKELIFQLVKELFPEDEKIVIKKNSNLIDLGIDSIKLTHLLVRIEEEFNLNLESIASLFDISKIRKIEDIVKLCRILKNRESKEM